MRRALIVLAVLAAGFGGMADAGVQDGQSRQEILAGDARGATALARSISPVLAWVSNDGAGSTPRSSPRRCDPPRAGSKLQLDLAAHALAFQTRVGHHRRYAGSLALARAGFHAFHTTTPPPFPLI